MKKNIFILIFFSLGFSMGGAGAFLRLPVGAVSLSLGSISSVIESGGHIAMQNPAMLSFQSGKNFSSSFAYLSLDRRWSALSYSGKLPPGATISIGWIHAGVNKIDGRNFQNEHTKYFSFSDDAFLISFAKQLHSKFSFGGTAKILQSSMPALEADGLKIDAGFGLDLGFVFVPQKNWKIAGAVRDWLSQTTWETYELFPYGLQYQEKFPIRFTCGTSIRISDYCLLLEWEKIPDVSENIKIGTQVFLPYNSKFRIGFDGEIIRCGGGIEWAFFKQSKTRLEYALDLGKVDEGVSHWFTWSFLR